MLHLFLKPAKNFLGFLSTSVDNKIITNYKKETPSLALDGVNNKVEANRITNGTTIEGKNNAVNATEFGHLEIDSKTSVATAEKINHNAIVKKGTLKAPEGKQLDIKEALSSQNGVLIGNIKAKKMEFSSGSTNAKDTILSGKFTVDVSKGTILPPVCNMDKKAIQSLPTGRKIQAIKTLGNPNYPTSKGMKV